MIENYSVHYEDQNTSSLFMHCKLYKQLVRAVYTDKK